MASLPDLLALLVQSAVRGASGGSRQCVAAATAAAIRVAAEVYLGVEAPSDTVLEAKERLGVIKQVITKRVEAGAEGLRANLREPCGRLGTGLSTTPSGLGLAFGAPFLRAPPTRA